MATKKKHLVKSVFKEGSRRAQGEAVRQTDLVKTTLRSRLESAIPSNLRWILPFAGELRGQPNLEETVETDAEAPLEDSITGTIAQAAPTPATAPLYDQYRCLTGNPLNCLYAQEATQQNTKKQDAKAPYCLQCGFPATLAEKAEIRGTRGRYRIDRWLRSRGVGRLYQGVQIPDEQPIVIKEYLLPKRHFSQLDMRQRQQAFTQLAGLCSVDGRIQDFRVLAPWEAIADHNQERCYLITRGTLDTQPTLQDYLTQYGAMTAIQVRHVLDQVLQTLDFLHRQKFQLPGGQIVNDPRVRTTTARSEAFAHGNLSLNSLLISGSQLFWQQAQAAQEPPPEKLIQANGKKEATFLDSMLLSTTTTTTTPTATIPAPQQSRNANTGFFIHVCDLSLWESLFNPLSAKLAAPSPQQDLVALGHIAFSLLVGQTHDRASGKALEPTEAQHWIPTDPNLKAFILRLIDVEAPFESAEAARQALLKLPPEPPIVEKIELIAPEAETPIAKPRVLWWLLGVLGFLVLGGLAWWLVSRPKATAVATDELLPCCIQKVPAVPEGTFKYTAEQQGTWNYVLRQKNLIRPDQSLELELQARKPKFSLDFQPIVVPALSDEGDDAVQKAVQTGKIQPLKAVSPMDVDFGITSRIRELGSDLEATTIAYDGLTVFVAFSYAKREQGLPNALKGTITFDQLRQLYTGKISHWNELDSRLPALRVKLYIPTEAEAIRTFEERALRDKGAIAKFRNLINRQGADAPFVSSPGSITIEPRSTSQMLIQVIQDFENRDIGAIGFSTLSKVFGYCSVYPLALDAGDRQPVQPLMQDSGTAIDPSTDLCDDKGGYHPNSQLFKTGRYPLAYPLAVVYPRDNSRPPAGEKFAEMLLTQEGQTLLQKTGLIPLNHP